MARAASAVVLALALSLALTAGACVVGSAGKPCLRNSDCIAGLACGADDRCAVLPDAPEGGDGGGATADASPAIDAAPGATADARPDAAPDPTPDAEGL